MDIALVVLRLIVGLLVAGHGAQKLFGWFRGPGLAGFAGWLDSMGLRPARLWAVLGGLAEFGGGLLLILGLFNPVGPLAIAASMLIAIAKAHWPKVWNFENGMELPLTNLAAAAVVGIAGPGAHSMDALFGTALPGWATGWALVLTLAGWAAGLIVSHQRLVKDVIEAPAQAVSRDKAA